MTAVTLNGHDHAVSWMFPIPGQTCHTDELLELLAAETLPM
jgi:hypothetical protein